MKLKSILKHQLGGLNKGAQKHLSATEQAMYRGAVAKKNSKLINYFENKINKGLVKDNKEQQSEIERLSELSGRDQRDGTNLVEKQSNANSWKAYIPLYNTLSGNSISLAVSDIKEAVSGRPEKTEEDYVAQRKINKTKDPDLKLYQQTQYNKKRNEANKQHTLENTISGVSNLVEPVTDVGSLITVGAKTIPILGKQLKNKLVSQISSKFNPIKNISDIGLSEMSKSATDSDNFLKILSDKNNLKNVIKLKDDYINNLNLLPELEKRSPAVFKTNLQEILSKDFDKLRNIDKNSKEEILNKLSSLQKQYTQDENPYIYLLLEQKKFGFDKRR
jgi:hypothetical protein